MSLDISIPLSNPWICLSFKVTFLWIVVPWVYRHQNPPFGRFLFTVSMYFLTIFDGVICFHPSTLLVDSFPETSSPFLFFCWGGIFRFNYREKNHAQVKTCKERCRIWVLPTNQPPENCGFLGLMPRLGFKKGVDVSENNGTPKSSILRGFSIINHPFGVPLFLETPVCWFVRW